MHLNYKYLPFILGLLFLISCAEPKYLDPNADQIPEAKEKPSRCSVQWKVSGLCFDWFWVKKASSSESGVLVFKSYRLNVFDQTPIEVDLQSKPNVVLWMPSMGHGSTPTETSRMDQGTYQSKNVFFIMPGEWEMRFQIKNDTEVIDEVVIPLVI
jgi:hypothetical protein